MVPPTEEVKADLKRKAEARSERGSEEKKNKLEATWGDMHTADEHDSSGAECCDIDLTQTASEEEQTPPYCNEEFDMNIEAEETLAAEDKQR